MNALPEWARDVLLRVGFTRAELDPLPPRMGTVLPFRHARPDASKPQRDQMRTSRP